MGKTIWKYAAHKRRTASIAPARPPAVMWVPKPTGFLSEDARDILTKDIELKRGVTRELDEVRESLVYILS